MESLAASVLFLHVACPMPAAQDETGQRDTAGLGQELLSRCEGHGGLVVHLGCQDATLLAAFARHDRFVVHGLAPDARTTHEIRAALAARELYGRASAEQLLDSKLPYGDQLVRLLAVEEPSPIAESELLRVLCPGGVLCRRSQWT